MLTISCSRARLACRMVFVFLFIRISLLRKSIRLVIFKCTLATFWLKAHACAKYDVEPSILRYILHYKHEIYTCSDIAVQYVITICWMLILYRIMSIQYM